MSVRFNTGTFGSHEPKANQDFESMSAGSVTAISGSTSTGVTELLDDQATFGQR